MDAPTITQPITSAAEKTFNLKNIFVIVFTLLILYLFFRWFINPTLVDANGNSIGTLSFKAKSFKKTTTEEQTV
ncbi:MAG: hypothetical protein RB294_10170 [Bacteroidales bacterium]|jgi:hypothetical protein|nr:hypothetical protein [Bacteroidales bacterium]